MLALRWDPLDELMLRLVGARRNRIPTLRERFSEAFGASDPNPELGPESAWHVVLDVRWRATRYLDVELSGFDAEVTDLIEQVPLGQGVEQNRNVGRARFAGAEAMLNLHPIDELEVQGGYAYLHARRLDADPPDDQIEATPEHQAVAGVIGRPWPAVEIATFLRLVGPQAFRDRSLPGSWGTLGAYLVWDARLELAPSPLVSVWLRGTNLADANYQTDYGFPDPGREIWLGARLTLD
jgi:iron complex outermembrane receptor protein